MKLSVAPLACLLLPWVGMAADLKPADLEFFESKIRPVLVSECYECHDAKKQKADLRLDFRDGILKGGENGPTIVPGNAQKSLLIQSITHAHEDLQMPKKRPKLDAKIIADFVSWVNRGAPDPRTAAPTDSITPAWADLLAVRKNWWSFQPVVNPSIPAGPASSPIDRFLNAKIIAAKLTPAVKADKATLLRRVTYTLTGLPPTTAEIAAFKADTSPEAYAQVIDRLLASPRYGEHFARHWMDLVRYADTHGSEGDPNIPQSWRYRDYLIRAFNDNVPYDQFVREQIAGDLLPQPRVNATEQLNESALGTGHFRLIEHGYQPVDTHDEQVRNVDNQIDVVSKTFLGLTVSCARCHDHKFDPISQADFYAFYGIFASSRPGQVTVDSPEQLGLHREKLSGLKQEIREALAAQWRQQAKDLPAALNRVRGQSGERGKLEQRLAQLEQTLAGDSFRQRLKAEKDAGPAPIHWWTFESDGRDLIGKLDAQMQGGARIRNGRLMLDGKAAFAETAATTESLAAKTLEAWVLLPTLAQSGGGVLTIESIDGKAFDSIVFAERQPQRWMSGSDNGARTQNVGGPVEKATPTELVHVAITYEADGKTTIYRNGQPYGKAYSPTSEAGGLYAFAQAKSHLLFGRRHTGGNNSFLQGEIEEARLYDFALTAEQIALSFRTDILRGEVPAVAASDATLQAAREEAGKLRAQLKESNHSDGKLVAGFAGETDPTHPLHASGLRRVGLRPNPPKAAPTDAPDWDLASATATAWSQHGNGMAGRITPGEFRVETSGPDVLRQILPSGLHSHTLSTKHSAVLTSPRFKITTDFISVQVMGRGATLRLIPDNYPLSPGGSRFPKAKVNSERATWVTLDTAYRKGSHAYLELTLPDDSPNPDGKLGVAGWFGVRQVRFHDGKVNAPKGVAVIATAPTLSTVSDVTDALVDAAQAWGRDQANEAQAVLLDNALRHGVLDAGLNTSPKLAQLVTEYRRLEEALKTPRRAPGFWEAPGFDQPLYTRGDHNKPAELIARRFLEILDAKPFKPTGSGRLELAAKISSGQNPLTARVMVNRLWHHTFGRGLVGTVDNFGRLGDQPTHPELLDYLAQRFVRERWSVKSLLRELLLTEAYQRSSTPAEGTATQDGPNDLLSHMRVRRLEGEALRDSCIALAGRLDARMYGPGDNALAPPREQVRRSVYLLIRRNTLNPLITTFDGPKPFTTVGKRDSTNVPVQSLTLLNDPFIIDTARRWSEQLEANASDEGKVNALFLQALGRPAHAKEQAAAARYLAELKSTPSANPNQVWADFAQSVLNLKEFLYVK
ncbi:MAG: hypothetical protein CK522_03855 [Opitutia bacterium]|nr:MAG: hypothetical protein CK522_03855 [Opitutae bacterium]